MRLCDRGDSLAMSLVTPMNEVLKHNLSLGSDTDPSHIFMSAEVLLSSRQFMISRS